MARSLSWIEHTSLAEQLDRIGVESVVEPSQADPLAERRGAYEDAWVDDDRLDEPTGPLPTPYDEPTLPDEQLSPAFRESLGIAAVAQSTEEVRFPPPIEPKDEVGYDEVSEALESPPQTNDGVDAVSSSADVEQSEGQLLLSQLSLETGLAALADALVEKTESKHCFIADDDGFPLALRGSGDEHAAAGAALRYAFSEYRELFDGSTERGFVLDYRNGSSLHVAWLETPDGTYTIGLCSPKRFKANLGKVMRTALGHVVESSSS